MTDQLQGYLAAFDEARARLHALADGMGDDAFNWKPDERAWSVGECVAHLNTMAVGYLPVLERAAADPSAPRAAGPFRYGVLSRFFVDSVRPGARPLPTASAMRPPPAEGRRSTVDKGRAMDGLDRLTDGYLAVGRAADGLDLRRIRVKSPFLPVWFSLGAYLDALGQHALRHTGQAERVAARPEFFGA